METEKKLTYTIEEVCKALNLSRPYVMAWIKRKTNPLPCVRTTKSYRIPCAALEQWLIEEANRNSKGA